MASPGGTLSAFAMYSKKKNSIEGDQKTTPRNNKKRVRSSRSECELKTPNSKKLILDTSQDDSKLGLKQLFNRSIDGIFMSPSPVNKKTPKKLKGAKQNTSIDIFSPGSKTQSNGISKNSTPKRLTPKKVPSAKKEKDLTKSQKLNRSVPLSTLNGSNNEDQEECDKNNESSITSTVLSTSDGKISSNAISGNATPNKLTPNKVSSAKKVKDSKKNQKPKFSQLFRARKESHNENGDALDSTNELDISTDILSPPSKIQANGVLGDPTPKKITSKKASITKKGPNLRKNKKLNEPTASVTEIDVHEKHEEECNTNIINPVEESTMLLDWLIHPMTIDEFFKRNWEKAPLHIKRNKTNYYQLLISTPMIDDILRKYNIIYTKNLDITSYSNGQRETHNPIGRAFPSVVWDYYSNGCSIRMLNPQTFIPKLHSLNSTLQEYFGCFVGANSYLTPPDSQGFAPHYDDIEAFILQIEGKKRWRLYKPRNEDEYLPRFSSKNFDDSEIGEPILDVVVEAGDLLYFPRGTIHQGETVDGTHSLHLTLSVYQKNSWGDFLEKLLPQALKSSIAHDSDFRAGLPLNYLNEIGLIHRKKDSEFRRKFVETTRELLHKIVDNIDVDKAADQMARGHVHDFLPPVLAPVEQECCVLQDGERMFAMGTVKNRVEIEPDTMIRLSRAHSVRLIEEENTWRVYFSQENSKEYHEYEPNFLEVAENLVPAVKEIFLRYPEFIKVDDLPIVGEDNKVQVARDLWERCIILTDRPLPVLED